MQLAQRIQEGSLPGRDWLLHVEPEEALGKLRESYELRALYTEIDAYLREYGCRCADEAKLETDDLTYDSSPIFVLLKTYISNPTQSTETRRDDKTDRRKEAELLISKMGGMRRWIMRWLVKQCSAAIADRESLRLLRSRTYGVPRRIFRAMGEHLYKLNLISSPKDIFWLTVDELENLIQGKAVSLDLKGMIHLRSTEYATYDQTPVPAERLVSRGLPALTSIYSAFHQQHQTQGVKDSNILVGTSCYPGRVEGKALVARTYTEAKVVNREILVAERTDPGWVTLYPVCSALVVERGSLLSHSAVVARELGLPTIIGVSGLTSSIRSGQHLIVDAGAGEVHIVPEAIEPTHSLS
jgi:pyruvate,water dikinase